MLLYTSSAGGLVGVPRSGGFWRFFPPTFAEELLSILYSVGLRIKIRHLWWPKICQTMLTLSLLAKPFSKLVRRHAVLVYSFNFSVPLQPTTTKRLVIKPNFLTSMGYHIFLTMVLRASAPSARAELRYKKADLLSQQT